ncbi:SAV_6107 family HEPN domain-containing protein [Allokutzneria oryzae]|uniref:SAV_6107 family HEPN domain-containing protein n=1 Tax=Allokutzneria oryzae TaxID=1378989 RepID=A0ABV5ZQP7_9PSEU
MPTLLGRRSVAGWGKHSATEHRRLPLGNPSITDVTLEAEMSVPLHFPVPSPRRPDNANAAVPAPRNPQAVALFAHAVRTLHEAEGSTSPADRYTVAYLAAIRGSAAVLAMRGRPHRARSRPASVWELLVTNAPELREWAAFFAAGSSRRAAVQAGASRLVDADVADDLVRRTGEFLALVRRIVHGAGR